MTAEEIEPGAVSGSFVPHRRPSLASAELDGETVVYDEDRRTLHTLNPSASIVWTCLDGTVTLNELANELAEAFAVEPTTMRDDVVGLARELGRQGLLEGVIADPEATAAHHVAQPGVGDHDDHC